eukprot:m.494313 g.494313  ORF g.494313 m.494313 type:complete len:534 (+) comp40235_c0_seq1:218-1819(+)
MGVSCTTLRLTNETMQDAMVSATLLSNTLNGVPRHSFAFVPANMSCGVDFGEGHHGGGGHYGGGGHHGGGGYHGGYHGGGGHGNQRAGNADPPSKGDCSSCGCVVGSDGIAPPSRNITATSTSVANISTTTTDTSKRRMLWIPSHDDGTSNVAGSRSSNWDKRCDTIEGIAVNDTVEITVEDGDTVVVVGGLGAKHNLPVGQTSTSASARSPSPSVCSTCLQSRTGSSTQVAQPSSLRVRRSQTGVVHASLLVVYRDGSQVVFRIGVPAKDCTDTVLLRESHVIINGKRRGNAIAHSPASPNQALPATLLSASVLFTNGTPWQATVNVEVLAVSVGDQSLRPQQDDAGGDDDDDWASARKPCATSVVLGVGGNDPPSNYRLNLRKAWRLVGPGWRKKNNIHPGGGAGSEQILFSVTARYTNLTSVTFELTLPMAVLDDPSIALPHNEVLLRPLDVLVNGEAKGGKPAFQLEFLPTPGYRRASPVPMFVPATAPAATDLFYSWENVDLGKSADVINAEAWEPADCARVRRAQLS